MTAPTQGAVLDAESVQTLKKGEKLVVILPPAPGDEWASKRQPALGEIVTCAGAIPYQVCVFLEEYEPGFGWHRSRFARLARPTPENPDEPCAPENAIDWPNTPPAQPEPGAGELEEAPVHLDAYYQQGWNDCLTQAQAKIARLEREVAVFRGRLEALTIELIAARREKRDAEADAAKVREAGADAFDRLCNIMHWRDRSHAHDADMGHPERTFLDEDDWENVEAAAALAAKRLHEAIAQTELGA